MMGMERAIQPQSVVGTDGGNPWDDIQWRAVQPSALARSRWRRRVREVFTESKKW